MAEPINTPFSGLVISVVSHGHGKLVHDLLEDLARFSHTTVTRVVLTLNLPGEALPVPAGPWPFTLQVRRNDQPLGFGANHNRALQDATEPCVCVLNPDIRLGAGDPFAALVATAREPGVGCAYPQQVDEDGRPQDSERALPTPAALWRRRILGRADDRVDWVNAACIVLPTPVWRGLGGFDERYFMYCEDVDLSLRVRLQGLALARAPVQVIHRAQRDSHRRAAHLAWHVRSLLRLWRSSVYRRAKTLLPLDTRMARTIGTP